MNASPAPEDSHDHCDHDHSHGQGVFFTIETFALVVWGAVLTYYVASGKVTPFLTTTGIFREQALVGGLLLFVVAVFNFAMRNRFPGCGHGRPIFVSRVLNVDAVGIAPDCDRVPPRRTPWRKMRWRRRHR